MLRTKLGMVVIHNKVVVIGPADSGKTTLIGALLRKPLGPVRPTVQAQVVSGRGQGETHLYLVDCGGNVFSHSCGKPQIADANYALLVFDASSKDSFEKLKKIVTTLGVAGSKCVLVGMKSDLDRAIAGPTDAEIAAANLGRYFAVNQHNVTELANFLN